MSFGQRRSANPAAMLASLMYKREKLQEELRSIENQVYELETKCLALKGLEGFLSSSKNATNTVVPHILGSHQTPKFQPEDRIFSLSSVTSSVKALMQHGLDETMSQKGLQQDYGRSDISPGRPKVGAMPVNGR
ncbi:hypothetical protein SLEP1_g373 [Rubroshorea leprosula]|uniref:Uncharacterized protein n=1 Tax=Rubroshorea leprosula TaxID=152421 RepID=A0AAV5HA67_9ROSI|nr:hypothetical protein SLEP1_g373 [Rubroshorea leprosula]